MAIRQLVKFWFPTMSTVLKRAKIDEQWHAHQGLGHAGLVDAFVYYSPWVMPGVIGLRTEGSYG
jgi:hypothetical protein